MLRIEEVQFANWGPLRPDTVPFMAHAINLITGTNGAAKTCFVNGIKVLLGVHFPRGSEPREYIFNPLALNLGAEVAGVDQAVLRGTFCNPFARGGHRFFSWEGSEFDSVEHVTVVCVVRRDELRYRILPGRVKWDDPISETLHAFFEEHPLSGQRWKGPRIYDQALTRMGVSQAMRGVLALPQGETGEILKKTPGELLRTILQLTGKQDILDAYAAERKKFEAAQAKHQQTMINLQLEKGTLREREREAERYGEWNRLRQERDRLRDVLIPAAQYRDKVVERDRQALAMEGLERRVVQNQGSVDALEKRVPNMDETLAELESQVADLRRRRDASLRYRDRLWVVVTRLQGKSLDATTRVQQAEMLIMGRTEEELRSALSEADHSHREVASTAERLRSEIDRLKGEAERLRAGHAAPPEDVTQFRDELGALGIEAILLADVLEPGSTAARQIEAALGDAVWALVVAPSNFRQAVGLARDRQYRWPLARGGTGELKDVLAGVSAPQKMTALLAAMDTVSAPDLNEALDTPNVSGAGPDGFYHWPSVAQLRGPAAPRIGRDARRRRLEEIEERLPLAEHDAHELHRRAAELQDTVTNLDEAVRLAPQVTELRTVAADLNGRLATAGDRHRTARQTHSAKDDELEGVVGRRGQMTSDLTHLRRQLDEERSRLAALRPQLEAARGDLRAAEEAIEAVVPPEAERQAFEAGELDPTDELDRRLKRLHNEVEDEERYPLHIRTDQVLTQRDEQRDVVNRAEETLGSTADDMAAHEVEITRAREAYDKNVNATIRLLDARFREICASANVAGELRRISGEGRGEYGLDILAAHKPGERPISYQRHVFHSGGQTVKVAILLLLAAMSMGEEGSSEMLIMDEPIAHMSVENADQIAEVIESLKDRAQFILAMPTNAETLRVNWAEWQISLLARAPGAPHSPPAQILSNLDVDPESRFASPQLVMQA